MYYMKSLPCHALWHCRVLVATYDQSAVLQEFDTLIVSIAIFSILIRQVTC